MLKDILFLILYTYAWTKHNLRFTTRKRPSGITGRLVFQFQDPKVEGKLFGVVAFVLLNNTPLELFSDDLYGPFGYSSEITIFGKHIYGLDDWGPVNYLQRAANPNLMSLGIEPQHTIQLAGVMRYRGRHIKKLRNPSDYVLPFK